MSALGNVVMERALAAAVLNREFTVLLVAPQMNWKVFKSVNDLKRKCCVSDEKF